MNRAQQLIDILQLAPHPEGGHYRELWRSDCNIQPRDDRGSRSALTTIYFLLRAGEVSRWHRVRSDEAWHLYEGGPIELLLVPPNLEIVRRVMLSAADAVNGPCHVVPAGWWQAARLASDYCLAGCSVGPGFDFDDFSFMRDDKNAAARLEQLDQSLLALL